MRRQLRQRRGDVHHRQGKAVIGGVGHVAGEHLVEQHAKAVQIGAGIDPLAANLLGTHIARRTDRQSGTGHDRAAAEGFGNAKVGQHRVAVLTKQDVLRLDIAVNDIAAVCVIQSADDGPGDGQRFGQRQTGADTLLQGAAGQVFHRQIIGALVRGDVIDGNDVRIAELGDDAAFAQEALGEFLIGGQNRLDDLERDMAMQGFLHCQVDDGHATLPEFAFDLVAWNMHVKVPMPDRAGG